MTLKRLILRIARAVRARAPEEISSGLPIDPSWLPIDLSDEHVSFPI